MKAAITAHLKFSSLGKFTGARSAWTPQTIEKTQRAFLRLLSGHLLNVYLMAQNLSHSSVGVNRYLYMDSVARKAAGKVTLAAGKAFVAKLDRSDVLDVVAT